MRVHDQIIKLNFFQLSSEFFHLPFEVKRYSRGECENCEKVDETCRLLDCILNEYAKLTGVFGVVAVQKKKEEKERVRTCSEEGRGTRGGWKIEIKGQWVIAVAWEAVWDKSNRSFSCSATLSSNHERKNRMKSLPGLIVLQDPVIGWSKSSMDTLAFLSTNFSRHRRVQTFSLLLSNLPNSLIFIHYRACAAQFMLCLEYENDPHSKVSKCCILKQKGRDSNVGERMERNRILTSHSILVQFFYCSEWTILPLLSRFRTMF